MDRETGQTKTARRRSERFMWTGENMGIGWPQPRDGRRSRRRARILAAKPPGHGTPRAHVL